MKSDSKLYTQYNINKKNVITEEKKALRNESGMRVSCEGSITSQYNTKNKERPEQNNKLFKKINVIFAGILVYD